MEKPAVRILVVDDEEILRNLLRRSLEKAGYLPYTASNGKEALSIFESTPVDLVLVDVRMPEMDGYTLCSELRKRSAVPIIMVTSLSQPDELMYSFSLGADDYITKPFQFREAEARIQAILRRTARLKEPANFPPLRAGNIMLHPANQQVHVDGRLVQLTPIEFQLLYYLVDAPDRSISKKELFQAAWGYDATDAVALVDAAIKQLWEKIEANPAQSVYVQAAGAMGYKFCTTSL